MKLSKVLELYGNIKDVDIPKVDLLEKQIREVKAQKDFSAKKSLATTIVETLESTTPDEWPDAFADFTTMLGEFTEPSEDQVYQFVPPAASTEFEDASDMKRKDTQEKTDKPDESEKAKKPDKSKKHKEVKAPTPAPTNAIEEPKVPASKAKTMPHQVTIELPQGFLNYRPDDIVIGQYILVLYFHSTNAIPFIPKISSEKYKVTYRDTTLEVNYIGGMYQDALNPEFTVLTFARMKE